MEKKFIIGRDNFALTIFIPQNCKNDCPFCTSKKDYSIHKENLEDVKEAIKSLKDVSIIKDIVITGGEPFANLDTLKEILSVIVNNLTYNKLFINTTMPAKNIEETIKFINARTSIINGINISRHIKDPFKDIVASIYDINNIDKEISVRINSVITDEINEIISDEDIMEFRNHWKDYPVYFRGDYRNITSENLHSNNYPLLKRLDNIFGLNGRHTQCNVCHTDFFDNKVSLHRGTIQSSLEFKNYIEVNDLIIRQDGAIFYDWPTDGKEKYAADFIEQFKNIQKFEPSGPNDFISIELLDNSNKVSMTDLSEYIKSVYGGKTINIKDLDGAILNIIKKNFGFNSIKDILSDGKEKPWDSDPESLEDFVKRIVKNTMKEEDEDDRWFDYQGGPSNLRCGDDRDIPSTPSSWFRGCGSGGCGGGFSCY